MSTVYPGWKADLLALVNRKNMLSLTESDVKFESFIPAEHPEACQVTIKPGDNCPYFFEQSITYVRRDIANAFTGIPVKIVLESVETTTIHAIIRAISDRYGFVFDPDVDFDAVTLATVIDFRDDISKKISIPIANTSMVWRGRLDLTVTNQHDVSPAHLYAGATTINGDIITIYPG